MHIIITGASSGIGKELAIALSKQSHKLSVCGRNSDKLKSTAEQLNQPYFSSAFNLTCNEALSSFTRSAIAKFGPVDALINCAGVNTSRGLGHEVPVSDLQSMMTINCYAPIELMQACIPTMIEQSAGTIINVLSSTCLYSNTNISAYTASKSALDAYTKVMRKELKDKGIKVLSVYPGGVDTDFRDADRPQYLSASSVSKAIIQLLDTDINTHIHELVIRPSCEDNFT